MKNKTALALTLSLCGASVAATLPGCASEESTKDAPNLTVTISGEGEALTGFAFPPASADDLAFVDGWDVRFDRILVTVDSIVLSDAPDTNPTNQAQTGPVLATAKGPWAVDMTKPGAVTNINPKAQTNAWNFGASSAALTAEGKDPHAQPLVRIESLDDRTGFDPSTRYAFGFDVVEASAAAHHTNLDAAAEADYADMQAKGLSVLYVGTATFKGVDCKSSDPTYDFGALPKTVKFRFGFKSPRVG